MRGGVNRSRAIMIVCVAINALALITESSADPAKPVGGYVLAQIWDDGHKPNPAPPSGGNAVGGVWGDGLKPVPQKDKAGATAIEYGKTLKNNPAAGESSKDTNKPTSNPANSK